MSASIRPECAMLFFTVRKEAWGVASLVICIAAYIIYLQKTLRHKEVQPHPLSWFVWAFVTGVATVIQWTKGAGAGAWVTALTTLGCVAIWILALIKQKGCHGHARHAHSSTFDWVSFGLSILAAVLFGFARKGTLAAVLATIADLVGYKPTVAKGWDHPRSDSAMAFFLNSMKFIPAYLALDTKLVATVLYPVALMIANMGVTVMLLSRRLRIPRDN